MKRLALATLTPLLALLITGCGSKEPKLQSSKLPTITSLKTISDMTEVGFEWTPTSDESVIGYYLYRSNPNKTDSQMKVVANIKDRFATHYVDNDLAPETTYNYQMRSYSESAISAPGVIVSATTKPLIESVPFSQAIAGLPSRVKIIWRPHPDVRVVSYVIERADVGKSNWSEIAEVRGRLNAEYIDSNVKDARSYQYRILVKTASGVLSKPSATLSATTKELPMGVSNLQASTNAPKKIVITWDSSVGADFSHYKVYRTSSKFLPYTYLVKTTSNSYEDFLNDNGATRYYKVTVVDKDGLESLKQSEPIVGKTLDAPPAPKITSAIYTNGAVKLSWSAVDRAVSYSIVKSGESERTINDISETSYTDSDVKPDSSYSYRVIAIDKYALGSDESDSVSVSTK